MVRVFSARKRLTMYATVAGITEQALIDAVMAELLTVADAAELLGITDVGVLGAIARGRLEPVYRVGRRALLVTRAAVAAYAADRGHAARRTPLGEQQGQRQRGQTERDEVDARRNDDRGAERDDGDHEEDLMGAEHGDSLPAAGDSSDPPTHPRRSN